MLRWVKLTLSRCYDEWNWRYPDVTVSKTDVIQMLRWVKSTLSRCYGEWNWHYPDDTVSETGVIQMLNFDPHFTVSEILHGHCIFIHMVRWVTPILTRRCVLIHIYVFLHTVFIFILRSARCNPDTLRCNSQFTVSEDTVFLSIIDCE